ncbi:MAG TPA: hypothetical protein VGZ72_03305 [Stellaceae bacterium]|jgi:hypothetical protein|nr:hypothetical protein [Stellaceae bacterium]
MSKPDRTTYEERVAEFLEPGEQVEKMLAGRPASFTRIFYPFGRINRQVLLTDRNLYVFELEGSERRMGGTPSKVLSKHKRGSAPVRYQVLPATLIVGEEQIRPAGRVMAARGKPIARAAATSSQTAGPP